MLSQQNSNTNLGRHQRQKSTPTKFDTSRIFLPAQFQQRQQREQHRRGLSLDQSIDIQGNNGFSQQDEHATSVEHILRQRLTQSTMREAQQQQQQTARPGFDELQEQEHIAGRQELQQYLTTNQTAPCQEPGPGSFTNSYPATQLTDFEDQVQNLLNNAYKTNTMDMLQSFDSNISAGNLDGFGNGLDGYIGNIQPNEIINTRTMSYSMPINEGSQLLTSMEGSQRPSTPQNQIRGSKQRLQK